MGDLAADTAVEPVGDGHFRAVLSGEWEIWGPMGGYVAAVALRAAGAVSPCSRPASLACQYLSVAKSDAVDVRVTTLRSGRRAACHRVAVEQDGKPVLEATVWSIGSVAGLEHHEAEAPQAADPETLRSMTDLFQDPPPPKVPFWQNVDSKPVDWPAEHPPKSAQPPVWRNWYRMQPVATWADPWVDAGRLAIMVDLQGWPAALNHHVWHGPGFIAPSLDLYVAFHEDASGSDWLLADGCSPIAGDGLVGWTGRLWSRSRRLVASGGGQLICRRTA